jgi:uncharacterized protein (UPF0264 family)
MAELLVSVRSASEAQAALVGGAALIDVKEPTRGPLGRADDAVIVAVLQRVQGRCPVSAAFGELVEDAVPRSGTRLAYAKWGMAGCRGREDLPAHLTELTAALRQTSPGCQPVAVAYADFERADSPPPEQVADLALQSEFAVLLVDTWAKDGHNLLDWMTPAQLLSLRVRCRTGGLRLALAGALGPKELVSLRKVRPDWFAVRGAACRGGVRDGAVSAMAVRRLRRLLDLPAAGTRRGN